MTKYRLKIHHDGSYKCLMSDNSFWSMKFCPHLEPHDFSSRKSAELYYQRWAKNYPVAAREWLPVIEEVEDDFKGTVRDASR